MALFEPVPHRKYISGQLIWFVIWLFITCIAVALTPNSSGHGTHQSLGLPPCPSVLVFDRPCPGCGLTTSWTAFVHGDFALAFRSHPLGPVLYSLFTISAVWGFIGYLRQHRFKSEEKTASLAMSIFVGVFVVFGIVRMITSPGFGTPEEKLLSQFTIRSEKPAPAPDPADR